MNKLEIICLICEIIIGIGIGLLLGIIIYKILKENKRKAEKEEERDFSSSEEYQKIFEEVANEEKLYKHMKNFIIKTLIILSLMVAIMIFVAVFEPIDNTKINQLLIWGTLLIGIILVFMIGGNDINANNRVVKSFLERVSGDIRLGSECQSQEEYLKAQFIKIDGEESRKPRNSLINPYGYVIEGVCSLDENIRNYRVRIYGNVKAYYYIHNRYNRHILPNNGSLLELNKKTFWKGMLVTIETNLKMLPIIIANNEATNNHLPAENIFDISGLETKSRFDIYTEDKESAKEFLTPELLSVIAKFEKENNVKIDITFDKKIYIRFYDIFFNLLNFDAFGSSKYKYKEAVHNYYIITKFIEELLENM